MERPDRGGGGEPIGMIVTGMLPSDRRRENGVPIDMLCWVCNQFTMSTGRGGSLLSLVSLSG